ncbi:MAG: hypothetical protein Q7T40_05285 [Methylobacter sp.]|nr:hypothetical protein [Methylobacter sp.]
MNRCVAAILLACSVASSTQAAEPRISVGVEHMLLVKSDGTLWSWGRDSWGQLGLNGTGDKNVPTQIPGASGFIDVVARGSFSMALKADGTVWAFGDNSNGRVGPYNDRTKVPVQVTGLSRIVAIGAGWGYSAYAIDEDGNLWSWGSNSAGQLGTGTSDIMSHPIPTLAPGLTGVSAISAADESMLALLSDGTAMGWGYNGDGGLGVTTVGSAVAPSPVTNLTGLKAIAATNINTTNGHFALDNNGSVWSWGDNNFSTVDCGQTRANSTAYTIPTVINNIPPVKQISGGDGHVLFVTESGTVAGCGVNSSGQLGDGTTTHISSTKPGPLLVSGLSRVTWVAAGNNASAAITDDGSVWTWGRTNSGISGTGVDGASDSHNTTPVKLNFNAGIPDSYPAIFAGTQSGDIRDAAIDVGFAPAATDVGKAGRLYIAAQLPDGSLFLANQSGDFKAYTGGTLPYIYEGALPHHGPISLGSGDFSFASGVTLILGYGVGNAAAAEADLFQAARYVGVLTLR